jgi:endonuclease G
VEYLASRPWRGLWVLPVLAFAITTLLSGPVLATSRNCTSPERDAANHALSLTASAKHQSISRNLPWGAPQSGLDASHEQLLTQRDYIIDYDEDLRVPIWTAHQLNAKSLRKLDRINCFRADPRLASEVASSPSDYKEPIFDQGHMTPNGDMALNTNAIINSFIMSNMTPQHCHFNRGIWEILETLGRFWAAQHGTLYVITGSIFDANNDGQRDGEAEITRMHSNNGQQRVAVPTAIYKIFAYKTIDRGIVTLTVVLPNDETAVTHDQAIDYLTGHVEQIAYVEKRTGLKFFPTLTGNIHEAAGATFWDTAGASFKGLDSSCPGN